jgi:hypothetical protein
MLYQGELAINLLKLGLSIRHHLRIDETSVGLLMS